MEETLLCELGERQAQQSLNEAKLDDIQRDMEG
jgi:hypothetical protein